MKKLLAILLSLVMLLSLAACGEPAEEETGENLQSTKAPTENNDPTGTTAAPPPADQWVDLVKTYHSTAGYLYVTCGEYTMNFSYNEDYTGGNVDFIYNDNGSNSTFTGDFTCDGNYNINYIYVIFREFELQMDMTFDDCHRLLSALIQYKERGDSEFQLYYQLEQSYNSQGKVTRSYYAFPRHERVSLTETSYDENCFMTGIVSDVNVNGVDNYSAQKFVREGGYMTAIEMYDANGQLIVSMPFSYEDLGDSVRYTGSDGYNDMTMVYDKQGNLLSQDSSAAGALSIRIEQTYDERGNLLTYTAYYAATGETIHYEYAYTADDRLISQTAFVNGELNSCTETTFANVLIPID